MQNKIELLFPIYFSLSECHVTPNEPELQSAIDTQKNVNSNKIRNGKLFKSDTGTYWKWKLLFLALLPYAL